MGWPSQWHAREWRKGILYVLMVATALLLSPPTSGSCFAMALMRDYWDGGA